MNVLSLLYLIPSVIGQKYFIHKQINASKNGSSGAFTSPGYPGSYPNNANYTWTLKTGNPHAMVSLNFLEFNIVKYRFSSKCEDYLQIKRIEPCCRLIMNRCGDFSPFDKRATGNIFVVTFVSDKIHNATGFDLTWRVYIPDTTAALPATTTTQITTTTTTTTTTIKPTTKKTTIKTRTSRTTTSPIPITKKSTKEIHTLQSALLTSNQNQQSTRTIGPFTKTTESYVVKEKADNQTATFNIREITYLIMAIVVIEVFLTAIGIYFVKQSRMNFRNLGREEINRNTTTPYSSISRDSGDGNYEKIQLKDVCNDHIEQQSMHNECTYIEIIEHEYDYTYGDVAPVRDNIL